MRVRLESNRLLTVLETTELNDLIKNCDGKWQSILKMNAGNKIVISCEFPNISRVSIFKTFLVKLYDYKELQLDGVTVLSIIKREP